MFPGKWAGTSIARALFSFPKFPEPIVEEFDENFEDGEKGDAEKESESSADVGQHVGDRHLVKKNIRFQICDEEPEVFFVVAPRTSSGRTAV